MAIYTTLFIATDEEIIATFPDARRRLDVPYEKQGVDPFTGKPMQIVCWYPPAPEGVEPISFFQTYGRNRVEPVEPPETDYEMFLESSAPPLVSTFPHTAIKGVELIELSEYILDGDRAAEWSFDCPDDEGCVTSLDRDAYELIAQMSGRDPERLAAKWAEKSHWMNHNAADCEWVLRRLQKLILVANCGNAHLFCHSIH